MVGGGGGGLCWVCFLMRKSWFILLRKRELYALLCDMWLSSVLCSVSLPCSAMGGSVIVAFPHLIVL